MNIRNKKNFSRLGAALLSFSILCSPTLLKADVVTGGLLTFNLNGDALANNPDTGWLAGFGVTLTLGQTLLEFAKHSQSNPAGRPAPIETVPTFSTIRDTWVRPSSSGLQYGYNSNQSLQTFSFDPATIATAGATGNIRFTGGDSFWFANQAVIDTGSVWIQYGNINLRYDPTQNVGLNSGWLFTNNLAGALDIFDIRNPMFSIGVNSLEISGDLYTRVGFRDFTAVAVGTNVGTFSFNGTTAVPEPSSLLLIGAIVPVVSSLRRRIATL